MRHGYIQKLKTQQQFHLEHRNGFSILSEYTEVKLEVEDGIFVKDTVIKTAEEIVGYKRRSQKLRCGKSRMQSRNYKTGNH